MATSQAVLLAPRLAALIPMTAAGVGRPNIPSVIWNTPATFFAQGYNNDGTDALDAIISRGIPPVLFWPFGCVYDPEPFFVCGRYANGWTDSYKNRSGTNRGGQDAFCQVLSQGDLEATVTGGLDYVNRLVTAMSTRYASTDNVLGRRFIYAGVPPLTAPTDTARINREVDACQRLNAVRICDLEGVLSPFKSDGSPTLHYLSRQREWELGRPIGSEVAHRELPETMMWRRQSAAVMHMVSFWDQAHFSYPENWLTIRELVEAGIRPMAVILSTGTVENPPNSPLRIAERRAAAVRMAGLGITPVVDVSSTPIADQNDLRDAVAAAGNTWANAAALAWAGTSVRGTKLAARVRSEIQAERPNATFWPEMATHRMPVHISGTREGRIVDPWADAPDTDPKAIHVDPARPDNSGNGFSRATAKKTIAGAGGGLSALSSTRIRLRLWSVNETVSAGLVWPEAADGTGPDDIAGIITHGPSSITTSGRLTISGLVDAAVLSIYNNNYRWFAVYGDHSLRLVQPGEFTTTNQGGIGVAVSQAVIDNFALQNVLFEGVKDPVVFNPSVVGGVPITSDNVVYRLCGNLRAVSRNASPINDNTSGGISTFGAKFVTIEACVMGVNEARAESGIRCNHAGWYAQNYAAGTLIGNLVHGGGLDGGTARNGGAIRYNVVLNSSMGLSSGSTPTDGADTSANTDIARNVISGSKYRTAAFDGEAVSEPTLPPLARGIIVAKSTTVRVAQNIITNANPATARDAIAVLISLSKGQITIEGNHIDRWARPTVEGTPTEVIFEEAPTDAAARSLVISGNVINTDQPVSIVRTLRPEFPTITASGNTYNTPAMVTNVAVAGVSTRVEWTAANWATNTGETIVLVALNPRAGVADWAQVNNITPTEAAVFDAALAQLAAGAITFQAVDIADWIGGQRGMWVVSSADQDRFSPAWQRRGIGVRPDGRRYSRAWARRGFGRRMGGA